MNHADLGLIGLGVMGRSLARNFHSRGSTVAVYDRDEPVLDAFIGEFGDERFVPTPSLPLLVAACKRPRVILMMITAGKPVDSVLDGLVPLLEPGDIVVDGGNSHFDGHRASGRSASPRTRCTSWAWA